MRDVTLPAYFNYWGKTRPADQAGESCHLLPYHCLDVAAVGVRYLREAPAIGKLLMNALRVDSEEALAGWLGFWLALHDVGKFSEAFQSQRPDLFGQLRGRAPDPAKPYAQMRHDSLGMLAWNEVLFKFSCEHEWFGAATEDYGDGLDWWARAITGHHGQPPKVGHARWGNYCDGREDREAVLAFAGDVRNLMLPDMAAASLMALDAENFEAVSKQLSWWVAGLTVLADWLGSNTDFFPYRGDAGNPVDLGIYWQEALHRADTALRAAGVLPPPIDSALSFSELFPHILQPSPLQDWAAAVELPAGPQIYLLEDVTGAGKTEAAVVLAHRLMAAGQADGFFIGLPTMATANAMYQRITQVYARMFAGPASMALAHANRNLVEAFAESVLPAGPDDADRAQHDESATARCAAWLADHNKRALLAPAGVGTIDQALLAVLHSKHQSLRLLGLFRKVLVVDEVHACDPYMQTVLESLLEFHALAGGSAILLSATLPARMKRSLLAAFARGRRQTPPGMTASDFPLITAWRSTVPDALLQHPVETRDDVRRELDVRYLSDEAEVVAGIDEALAAGKCVCWMRNTVADALAAHALFAERLPQEKMLLFHARFCLQDRLRIEGEVLRHFGKDSVPEQRVGRLVIATQVAEQSLDADWDLVVTDLAPIDRLIQRAGRQQRHPRDVHGRRLDDPQARDQRGRPCLWVFGPAWTDDPSLRWFKDALPKAASVYPHHGQLWLTARCLQRGRFAMPDDGRELIEAVFGGDADIPEGLQGNANRAEGNDWADISVAQQNVVKLVSGYERGQILDWWSEAKTPSRLGEPSMTVLLVRWAGERLRPWADHPDPRHAWAYSSVRVAERLIVQRAKDENLEREAAIEQLLLTLPGKGAWSVLLVLALQGRDWVGRAHSIGQDEKVGEPLAWMYSDRIGLVGLGVGVPDGGAVRLNPCDSRERVCDRSS